LYFDTDSTPHVPSAELNIDSFFIRQQHLAWKA